MDELLALLNHDARPPTAERVLGALTVTAACGMFIFQIYKRTFRGVLYTRNFNVGLVLIALVTTLIIVPISSNITLSLGMVGALSIVRFRTAIKDPVDIVFMFWAIAIGVANGAGFYVVSIVGSLFIGAMLFILQAVAGMGRGPAPYLLVLHYDPAAESQVAALTKTYNLKAKNRTRETVELTVELQLQDQDTAVLDELLALDGVRDGALIAYNGDFVT